MKDSDLSLIWQIVLRTNCIDKMLTFYCDILGCHIENQQKELRLIQLKAGDNLIDLVEVDGLIDHSMQNLEHFVCKLTIMIMTSILKNWM